MSDGRTFVRHIDQVIGSRERPMSDRDLDAKVAGLCEGVLPAAKAQVLIETCRALSRLTDAAVLARAATL
jgi:hypothetical protein